MAPSRILVIKLSALGDFILALGAMEAIRKNHKEAHITLLTTAPFQDLAQRSGYFDDVIIDPRPRLFDPAGWLFLFRALNRGGYDRVYDLQMNNRTALYYRLFRRKPEWSGLLEGSLLSYVNPDYKKLHAFTRHQEVLKVAGIEVGLPDISWMQADVSFFAPPKPYVLFIPGSAPQHPGKRWPAMRYAALGLKLIRDGYHVAVLGTNAEADALARVVKSCPGAIDLGGRTSLYDVASLARGAAGCVGNDTGPAHLVALAGCPTVVLFSTALSDPARSAPVGAAVRTIQAEGDLDDVSVTTVYETIRGSLR